MTLFAVAGWFWFIVALLLVVVVLLAVTRGRW